MTTSRPPVRRMSLISCVATLYFMVSGGPYGLEELAKKVGFGVAILVLLLTPLVWSIPTALMVGELAAALPEEGGYYAWVRRALGPFWGYQEAWLSLTASVFDMGIYPTLFGLYVARLSPAAGVSPLFIGILVVVVGAAFNIAGARIVGHGSTAMTALLMSPFVVLSCLAIVLPARAGVAPGHALASRDVAGGVLVAMWNYMGWDNISTIASEVDRPQRTYPLAVLSAVALIAVTYVVPMAAMRAGGVDSSTWDTGAWVDAARSYGGAPLAVAVVAGGMVSAFGMYGALCLSYSRLPFVLAEDGYLPRILTRRLRRGGAPWVAIMACSVAWTLSLGLSFERLVSLDILLYGASLLLEFVALAVLRVREPGLARPFRVPGGLTVACVLGVGPAALLVFALVKNLNESIAGVNALAFGAAVIALGPASYVALRPGPRGVVRSRSG